MLSWVDGGPSPLLFCYTLMAYRESQSGQFRKSRWNLESEAASFNFWLEIQRFSCLFSVKWNHSEHPKLQEKGELIVGSSQITDWSQTAQQAAPMPGICCQDSVDQFFWSSDEFHLEITAVIWHLQKSPWLCVSAAGEESLLCSRTFLLVLPGSQSKARVVTS